MGYEATCKKEGGITKFNFQPDEPLVFIISEKTDLIHQVFLHYACDTSLTSFTYLFFIYCVPHILVCLESCINHSPMFLLA